MQDLSKWGDWLSGPPSNHDAHYWTAKDTLHAHHVKVFLNLLMDFKWEALGFRRVTSWGTPVEELITQPSFRYITNLPILTTLDLSDTIRKIDEIDQEE